MLLPQQGCHSHHHHLLPLLLLTWLSLLSSVTMATTTTTTTADLCSFITNSNCRCFKSTSSSSSTEKIDVACTFSSGLLPSALVSAEKTANISVRTLNLSNNALEALPPDFFHGIASVYALDLSLNAFIQIPPVLATLSSVQILDLSDNLLPRMSLSHVASVPGLVTLDLSRNRIRALTSPQRETTGVKSFLRLQTLNLSGNEIDRIDRDFFYPTRHLLTLNLSGNRLGEVTDAMFSWLAFGLSRLDLSRNALRRLEPWALGRLQHLLHLSLAYNPLPRVTAVRFPAHLRTLDLSHCALTILDHCRLTSLLDLRVIELLGNDLRCSCQLYLLHQWYKEQHHKAESWQTSNDASNNSSSHWTCTTTPAPLTLTHPSPNQRTTTTPTTPTTNSSSSSTVMGVEEQRNKATVRYVQDLRGCDDTESHCPTLEHAQTHHNGSSSQMEVSLDVVSSDDTLMASWTFRNTGQVPVDGFQLHYFPEDSQPLDSPLIPPGARSYVLAPLQLERHFMVCLSVVAHQTTILHQQCRSFKDESQNVISGILASVVFLAPCLAVLVYVMVKDRRIRKRWTFPQRPCSHESHDAENSPDQETVGAKRKCDVDHVFRGPQTTHSACGEFEERRPPPHSIPATPGERGRNTKAESEQKKGGSTSHVSVDSQTQHVPISSARRGNSGTGGVVYNNTIITTPIYEACNDQLHHQISSNYQLAFIPPARGASDEATDGNCQPKISDVETMMTRFHHHTTAQRNEKAADPAFVVGADNPSFVQDRGADCMGHSDSTRF